MEPFLGPESQEIDPGSFFLKYCTENSALVQEGRCRLLQSLEALSPEAGGQIAVLVRLMESGCVLRSLPDWGPLCRVWPLTRRICGNHALGIYLTKVGDERMAAGLSVMMLMYIAAVPLRRHCCYGNGYELCVAVCPTHLFCMKVSLTWL